MKTIERLRELLAKCKFGTTRVARADGETGDGYPDCFDVIAENGDALAYVYLRDQCHSEDGAALLSESCNALPALLALVEAQAAEIEAWRKAADKYTGDIRVVYGQAGHIATIKAARDTTDAALRALEGGAG